jgi:hypothetical protein
MNNEAKKLFLENYFNRGDCEGLLEKTKIIEKEFKRTGEVKIIRYLHWALVERIFRLQGGVVEVKNWKFEVPFTTTVQTYDDNGEVIIKEEENNALFIHLQATWQGETLDEYYPIFDNQTSKIIKLPDAQDLNTARQRGMVRLIARISGIGLTIFEKTDDQFNEEDDTEAIIEQSKISPKVNEPAKPEKNLPPEKKCVSPEQTDTVKNEMVEKRHPKENDFLAMMLGEDVSNIVPQTTETEEEDYGKETEQYAEKKLAIKKHVATNQKTILEYMNKHGASLLGDLTYKQLSELENIIINNNK